MKINYKEMARGYREMADINISISESFFNLENEIMESGVDINEMDKKEE